MRRAGFTLMEVLVALVILGFLMAGLTQGVRFGVQGWSTQTRRIATGSDLDSVDRALRRMIEDEEPGDTQDPISFRGEPHVLTLWTRLPMSAVGGPTRQAQVGLGVDLQHRLVLRATPKPRAQRLGAPAPAAESVLLENVDHVDFAYWSAGPRKPGWLTGWRDVEVPTLVRVAIAFRKGDPRHWPDLIARPMRSRLHD